MHTHVHTLSKHTLSSQTHTFRKYLELRLSMNTRLVLSSGFWAPGKVGPKDMWCTVCVMFRSFGMLRPFSSCGSRTGRGESASAHGRGDPGGSKETAEPAVQRQQDLSSSGRAAAASKEAEHSSAV